MAKISITDKKPLPKMVSFTMVSTKFDNRNGKLKIDPKTAEKFKGKLNTVWEALENFCVNSGIDALRYFADRKRHWFERIWWLAAVALSFCFCAYLIGDIWNKRANYPVTVIHDDKISTIGSISFPAVTICPPVRIAVNVFNLSNFLEKFSDNWPYSFVNATLAEKFHLSATLQICRNVLRQMFARNETNLIKRHEIVDAIMDLAIRKRDLFQNTNWLGMPVRNKMFRKVLTERGPCYSFNMLNSRSIYSDAVAPELFMVSGNPDVGTWDMESELLNLSLPIDLRPSIPPAYPYHLLRMDDGDSLTFKLNFVPDDFYWNYECDVPLTRSFKVFLHRSDEIKEAFDQPFEVEVGKKVSVLITPNVVTTSNDVRKYSSKMRQCFFNSERQLRFFKVYTKSNCEHECLANFTKSECGCVKFVMPRDAKTLICDVNDLLCYSAAVKKHRQMRYVNDTYAADFRNRCNCLPSCVDISYETQIAELKYIHPDDDEGVNMSTFLTLSFKSNEFLILKRSEMYTMTNMFSTCGGLLGLFMGISLLSITEIIVHCAIRLAHKLTERKSFQLYTYTP